MGLEQYHVKQLLRSTGTVEVYAADAVGTSQPAEVWILDRLFAAAAAAAEVRRRLRLALLLDHPAAVTILDKSLDEPPFFVARRPRSETTLETRFGAEVPLPIPRAVSI